MDAIQTLPQWVPFPIKVKTVSPFLKPKKKIEVQPLAE
jgi:hypothetical protein